MFVVDDPMLVLTLRLVVDTEGNPSANREFLDQQLKAIKHYLAQYPAEEHGDRAMEWVVQRAAQYRRGWESDAFALLSYPSLTVIAVLGLSGFCLIYGMTNDVKTPTAKVDPRMKDDLASMSNHMGDLSRNIAVMVPASPRGCWCRVLVHGAPKRCGSPVARTSIGRFRYCPTQTAAVTHLHSPATT